MAELNQLLEEERVIVEDINSLARSLQLVMADRAKELVVILSGRRDEVERFAVRDGARHQHSDMIRAWPFSSLVEGNVKIEAEPKR